MEKQLLFTHQLIALKSDIDHLNHVNNVVYVRWVQEVAAAHWDAMASKELKNKYAWMLIRHEIDYLSQAYEGDIITGETWVGETKGATFERFVELSKGDQILTKSKMIWCLLDSQTLKPKRVDSMMIELVKKVSP